MKFGAEHFWSLLMAMTLSSSLLAVADDTQQPANKPFSFAKPADGDDKTAPLLDTIQQDDPFRAPLNLFSRKSPSSPLPPPPNYNSSRPDSNKQEWILMSPDEILGVKTPEQILGVQSAEEAKSARETPEQQFLDRENRAEFSNTNGVAGGGLFSDSLWSKSYSTKPENSSDQANNGFQSLSRVLNVDRSDNPFFQRNDNSAWSGSSQFSEPTPAQIAKQKADMDEFHVLLGDSPVKKADANSANGYDSAAQRARNASAIDPLLSNPYGTSYKPLADSAVKPVGVSPLSAWNTPVKKKTEAPSWAPKPPPWLSQNPQTINQERRF